MRPAAALLHPLCALLLIQFGSGCAHYQFPISQLEAPEARGTSITEARPGRIELLFLTGTDLIAPPGYSYPEPETPEETPGPPTPIAQKAVNGAFGFSLSLGEKIDAGLRLQPEAPVTLRFKYQVAGEPETRAAAGNLSASLCAAPGVLLGQSGSQSVFYLSGEVSVPVGYRLSRSQLVALTPFFGFASVSNLPQSVSGAGSLSASRFGAALGYQYTVEALFARGEASYVSGSVGSVSISGPFFGASVGFSL